MPASSRCASARRAASASNDELIENMASSRARSAGSVTSPVEAGVVETAPGSWRRSPGERPSTPADAALSREAPRPESRPSESWRRPGGGRYFGSMPWVRSSRARSASRSSLVVSSPASPNAPRFLLGKNEKQPNAPMPPTGWPLIGGADRLRGILDDGDCRPPGQLHDRIHIGALAEQMDRQNRLRACAHRRGHRDRVDIERLAVDVHEHGPRAKPRDGRPSRKRNTPSSRLRRRRRRRAPSGEQQRIGARGHGDGVANPELDRKLASSASISGPMMNRWLSQTAVMAARSSARESDDIEPGGRAAALSRTWPSVRCVLHRRRRAHWRPRQAPHNITWDGRTHCGARARTG